MKNTSLLILRLALQVFNETLTGIASGCRDTSALAPRIQSNIGAGNTSDL
jgi:hypothetical protein